MNPDVKQHSHSAWSSFVETVLNLNLIIGLAIALYAAAEFVNGLLSRPSFHVLSFLCQVGS